MRRSPMFLASLLGLSVVHPLSAQEATLPVMQLQAPTGGLLDFNHVQGARTPGHLESVLGFTFSYASLPLIYTLDDGGYVSLLVRQPQVDLTAALGVGSRFSLGLAMPVVIGQQAGSSELAPQVPAGGPGDLRLVPRVRILGEEGLLGLAAGLTLSLPTGNGAAYTGEQSATVKPEVALELRPGERFRAAANLGYLLRKPVTQLGLTVSSELTYGAGLGLTLLPGKLELLGEAFGRVSADPDDGIFRSTLPLELLLSARLKPGATHAVTLGAGPGLNHGYGTPRIRVVLGYSAMLGGQTPPTDRDGDATMDAQDRCPHDAEDLDGFQDEDGCPELDNDGDGVADVQDKCPSASEDTDRFQDEDGCPDPDNDDDGLTDPRDQCPDHAETPNGVRDDDGCPEKDSDADGLLDEADQCPDQAETRNGYQDSDGCADQKPQVEIVAQEITLSEKVYFEPGTAILKATSQELLKVVASVLKEHPEVTRARLGGHSDSLGGAQRNLELSQLRAEAVKTFLVEQGIDAGRLEAKGYGSSRPIASNDTEEGRDQNRRVQFTVLEINGKPVR